jgi:hypothetical protein
MMSCGLPMYCLGTILLLASISLNCMASVTVAGAKPWRLVVSCIVFPYKFFEGFEDQDADAGHKLISLVNIRVGYV